MEIVVGEGVRWSVIIPSFNGVDTLADCLAAVAALRPPQGRHEVIVIDNASTDGTSAFLADFAARSGARFLSEPRKGKSWALNTAIEHAEGEMLVFLDDDIIADPDLLEAYAEADRHFPSIAIFAGQVLPSWRGTPPGWLAELADRGQSCGCTPVGRAEGPLAATDVKGGNMVIRRQALGTSRFSTGDVNFGGGEAESGGEDTELVRRVSGKGELLFVPEAKVAHIVGPSEMTWRGVFGRYKRIGRGNAAQGLATRNPVRLAGEIVVLSVLAGWALLVRGQAAAAAEVIRIAMRFGALDHALGQRNGR